MQEMDDSAERLQAAERVLGNMEQRAIAAETAVEPLMQRVAVLERSGRAEAAARIAYLEQQLQQSEANEAQFGEQLSRARERARQVEGQAQVSQARLAKFTTAQEELRECKQEADEARADLEEMEEQDDWKGRFSELQAQLKSGQSWQLTRPKGSGRGARMLQWGHRVAIWQQLANGTPPSAIGANICTVAKAAAPWLNPVEPTVSTIRQERFALGIGEEAMAARRVAEAHTVRQIGFDETTKFQDPSMTTAMVVQPKQGAPLEVVILRAAYAIGGATSEACAQGIEAKCFERLRQHLRGWETTFGRMFPSLEWTGPGVEQCGLQRLGGGGAVISDTCTPARKTKRLLILMVAKQIEEKHPNWGELSSVEQEEAVRVHTHDCWQHIRNIFLGPMSKAQSAHTKEQLAEKLAFFAAHERMTTDFDHLLRADYKEFHPGGRYAKGHGKQYSVWLKVHRHPRLVSHSRHPRAPQTRRAHATHTPRTRHAHATHTPCTRTRHAHARHTPRARRATHTLPPCDRAAGRAPKGLCDAARARRGRTARSGLRRGGADVHQPAVHGRVAGAASLRLQPPEHPAGLHLPDAHAGGVRGHDARQRRRGLADRPALPLVRW